MINDLVGVSTNANRQAAVILPAIFVSIHRKNPIFKAVRECDKSNSFIYEFLVAIMIIVYRPQAILELGRESLMKIIHA